MYLFLDTTDRYKKIIRLMDGKKVIDELIVEDDVVSGIKKLLGTRNLSLDTIDRVTINEGPGSFTGLKVGAAIANALNYALGNLKDFKKLIIPNYGKKPNIGKKKG